MKKRLAYCKWQARQAFCVLYIQHKHNIIEIISEKLVLSFIENVLFVSWLWLAHLVV